MKSSKMLSQMLDTLDTNNTVIHLHTWTKALSSSIVRVAIKKGFKVVCTLHDYFTVCPNGGFFNYNTRRPCLIKPLTIKCIMTNCDSRNYTQKLWRICRQFVQNLVGLIPSGINDYILVSEFSGNILRPFLPQDANFHFVPNPVDVIKSMPVEVTRNSSYMAIGRLSREKGMSLFARAAKIGGYRGVFVGDGECRPEIKSINPDAEIVGWISQSEVNEHLEKARTLVLPSLLYETQGLVVLEAAALGVPAIVPDNCAARDLVKDGVTGLWFRSGDVEDLVKKMRILEDEDTLLSLGRAAYESYWVKPSTMERHTYCLEKVYTELLERKV